MYKQRITVTQLARRVVELHTDVAELGSIEALFYLGNVYDRGEGVHGVLPRVQAKGQRWRCKDTLRADNLGNHERAVRHFLPDLGQNGAFGFT